MGPQGAAGGGVLDAASTRDGNARRALPEPRVNLRAGGGGRLRCEPAIGTAAAAAAPRRGGEDTGRLAWRKRDRKAGLSCVTARHVMKAMMRVWLGKGREAAGVWGRATEALPASRLSPSCITASLESAIHVTRWCHVAVTAPRRSPVTG